MCGDNSQPARTVWRYTLARGACLIDFVISNTKNVAIRNYFTFNRKNSFKIACGVNLLTKFGIESGISTRVFTVGKTFCIIYDYKMYLSLINMYEEYVFQYEKTLFK